MSEFTPGPWNTKRYQTTSITIFDTYGTYIAEVKSSVFTNTPQREDANAYLVAAAPEMYEALSKVEYFLHELRSNHGIDGWSGEQQVIDALRKARGEATP